MDHEEAVPNPHYLMYCVCVTVHKENYTAKMIFWMYRSQEENLCVYEETFVTEMVVQFLFEIHNIILDFYRGVIVALADMIIAM